MKMQRMITIGLALSAIGLVSRVSYAGSINAEVDPILSLSSETYFTDISDALSADEGDTAVKISSGVIDCNSEDGWKLTVTSANLGKLIRTTGTTANEITYTNIVLAKTGGVLGTGLTDPDTASKAVTSGECVFDTGGAAVIGTTATVGYAFELRISWDADTTLLSGTYGDTITMTVAVDNV